MWRTIQMNVDSIVRANANSPSCSYREPTSILTMKNGVKGKRKALHLSIDIWKTRNCLRGTLGTVRNQAWSKSRDTNLINRTRKRTINGTWQVSRVLAHKEDMREKGCDTLTRAEFFTGCVHVGLVWREWRIWSWQLRSTSSVLWTLACL